MGGFRRAFLGYRRAEVDAAIASRDIRAAQLEKELASLSSLMVGQEREVETLRVSLRTANDRQERSLAALEAVARRLEEMHAQARGQATRIRMKALADAVEINRRVKEISDRLEVEPASNGSEPIPIGRTPAELYEGKVEVDIGPLGDFSQLVGFEDAAGRIGATSEISVSKFSEGRATLSMRLDEPVELLRELERRSPLDFRVRKTAEDRVVLDLDDDAAEAA
jgi:chromosome segregation ATPase